jgi:hypothetical protein
MSNHDDVDLCDYEKKDFENKEIKLIQSDETTVRVNNWSLGKISNRGIMKILH